MGRFEPSGSARADEASKLQTTWVEAPLAPRSGFALD
jgi:hypothetical protein